jgi:hypothetical protein
MRSSAAALALPLLFAALAGAASPITETEALESARELVARVAAYGARHPDAAGAFSPWAAADVEAGTPLLVNSYPDLRPLYYYVPLSASSQGCESFITLDPADGAFHAYGRRPHNLPSVSRGAAARLAGLQLRCPVNANSLLVVKLPDRQLYWRASSADSGRTIFIAVCDSTAILSSAPAAARAALTVEPPARSDGVDRAPGGVRHGRAGRDHPPAFDIPDVPHHYQITSYHCGPATVQMLMDYWGPTIDQQAIGQVADTEGSGTHLSDMMRAAHFSAISTATQNHSLHGYPERRMGYGGVECYWSYPSEYDPDFPDRHDDLKSIISDSYPVIVVMKYSPDEYGSHARVLKGYDDTTGVYILHDPWYSGVYQGPDIHFNQSVFDDLWSRSYRWGGFVSPWEIEFEAPDEVLQGVPFTVTAYVTYTGPHPFDGEDGVVYPTVEPLPSDLCELAPGQEAVLSLHGWFSDSGCHFDPVSWDMVADTLSQSGAIEFVARGLLNSSSSSYAAYSDSIGGHGQLPFHVVDPELVTVDASGGGHFTRIQDALDYVRDGHEVELLPGTYSGPGNRDLSFRGKRVTLRGVAGPDETVIDCEGVGRGFSLSDGEGRDTVIEGITIKGGSAPDTGRAGAGGGVFLNGASPTIRDVTVRDCTSHGPAGGMCCVNGSSPLLDRVRFAGNVAEGDEGGGLFCSVDSHPSLQRCVFLENEAASRGGAVACGAGAVPELINCTLALNSARDCGGVYCEDSSPLITDSIIYGSTAGCALACDGASHPVLTSCLVHGNEGGDGLPASCEVVGVVFADPLLCDVWRGELHLQECSPCAGAGTVGGDIGAFRVRCACEQNDVVPAGFLMHPASPSPFTASTTLRLDVPAGAGRVSLSIYNVRGQLVRTLVDGTVTPGVREYVWRGDDSSGHALSAGLYFARCEHGGDTTTRKLVLVR